MMQVYAYLAIQIHFCCFERADARTSGGTKTKNSGIHKTAQQK